MAHLSEPGLVMIKLISLIPCCRLISKISLPDSYRD
jgi:hypothetical protein